jgi:hypothetical protein
MNNTLTCDQWRALIDTKPCRITEKGREAIMKHGAECLWCAEYLAKRIRTLEPPCKKKEKRK